MAVRANHVPGWIIPIGIAFIWVLAQSSTLVLAHESWISPGGYRNPAGEWCCRNDDCQPPDQVAVTGKSWIVDGTEFVPF